MSDTTTPTMGVTEFGLQRVLRVLDQVADIDPEDLWGEDPSEEERVLSAAARAAAHAFRVYLDGLPEGVYMHTLTPSDVASRARVEPTLVEPSWSMLSNPDNWKAVY